MKTQLAAISIGCNAVTRAVSWSDDGILAFGANRAVAIYDPTSSFGVRETLIGHSDRVTVVRWLDSSTIVSGASDKKIKVWRQSDGIWNCVQTFEDHAKSISALAVCPGYFVSGSMDGCFNLYSVDESNGQSRLIQKLTYRPALPLALALTRLPGTESLLLAVGGTTTAIHLYGSSENSPNSTDIQLELKAKLTGHEDWIRAFDFMVDGDSVLLASASQDRYIRLWRIDQRRKPQEDTGNENGAEELVVLENKAHDFAVPDGHWKASFEALLVAHEDWVFSAQLSRDIDGTPILLSSSADSSVIVWRPDTESQIWTVQAQLGTISTKGASTATGSTGGFWGALFSPTSVKDRLVCAWNKTGSIRVWHKDEGEGNAWRNVGGVGGHVKEVRSLSWSPGGEYFLTTSLDQSTRLWAKHVDDTWKEFARPQIHGYDIQSIHVVSPTLFISGAEEKIVRVFQATSSVVDMLARVAGIDFRHESTAEAANVPALGLSNKALTSADQGTHLDRSELEETLEKENIPLSKAMLDTLNRPPTEDHLQRHTLFPELEKLYGHGYEIQALSASHDGRFIVSGCRSTTPEHASLRLYDTTKYKELAKLDGHSLTATKARFSKDDKYLLSVSRDRALCLFARTEDGNNYRLLQKVLKAHKRIVWDCAWLNTTVFATASRDATASIWSIEDGKVHKLSTIDVGTAVTAITWSAACEVGPILTLGLEDGTIQFYETVLAGASSTSTALHTVRHCDAAITGLEYRPSSDGGEVLELAFCSEDCSALLSMSGMNHEKGKLDLLAESVEGEGEADAGVDVGESGLTTEPCHLVCLQPVSLDALHLVVGVEDGGPVPGEVIDDEEAAIDAPGETGEGGGHVGDVMERHGTHAVREGSVVDDLVGPFEEHLESPDARPGTGGHLAPEHINHAARRVDADPGRDRAVVLERQDARATAQFQHGVGG
ncbi:protein of unknown function [Taphrina deformans PYCC 5710]|uniref:Elongator complex protein 2 n=1 Tax=Taphrina deformans (strain PYCC 5710 / ATCC 11124 / CBS 356.35 / IMI 108563 / JCM 9778 / NBRC 8474) TaxID=1097556 RepID=R4XEX5_TAPDE|nr:protein of unknown function [Taphrina deformans PYCC 5710]|eukprot:CCG84417.1 protein of unknown function [Taphrina deformans PYCC 5710]